ncbi:MauE/DoxX family redox-associated membrane protein [Phycicoccus sonneratiae]|uniref:DoxX family membrane protein n=1 Tax=Phycicoccus sonneratiae TaxID=2807628 RepID=A0ABS2CP97_9MICO|nr:MauE/DoxX family redox-associated membrane protein [Phycicoccus sonneraticus]MBM6400884.1 DoxX family membrane protein [Phycicoccus sonneraticus]
MLTGTARAVALDVLVLLAGAVWLWAGLAKLRTPFSRTDVDDLVPGLGRFHPVLRWAVPLLEVAVGAALVLGVATRAAGVVGVILAGTFAALHVGAMLRAGLADAPLRAGCGCLGGSRAAVAAPAGGSLDTATVGVRGWVLARAAVLAMVTWTAVLPCALCAS